MKTIQPANPNCKLRSVNTKFWDDVYVIDLDPIEKLLFLYFLTCPLTNLAGVYEVSLRRIAFDTGIDRDMVKKILERFENDKKIFYKDGFIILVNYQKNQKYTSTMKINVDNTLDALPVEINEFYQKVMNSGEIYPIDRASISRSRSKVEGEVEIEVESKVEDEKITPLPSTPYPDSKISFSTSTDYKNYTPKTYDDPLHVKNCIEKLFRTFTDLNPDTGTKTTFYNIIMDRKYEEPDLTFQILYDMCFEFKNIPPEKQNFRYFNKTLNDKREDKLRKRSEVEERKRKLQEKKEMKIFEDQNKHPEKWDGFAESILKGKSIN